jgi:hypothetical protein
VKRCYNPDNGSWSAYVYRDGRYRHVGTYPSRDEAVAAYEEALRGENPALHAAPARVERPSNPVADERGDPDASCLSEAR